MFWLRFVSILKLNFYKFLNVGFEFFHGCDAAGFLKAGSVNFYEVLR